MAVKNLGYNGNPNLPKAGAQYNMTPEMVREMAKCAEDPVYFAETYFKIVHVDKGLIPFTLYDYQKEAAIASTKHRNILMCASRQCGKTSVATVIILHYALFNKHKRIALLANKGDTAREILSRIQLAYEYIPNWMKCGVCEWNKGSVEFDNGTIIIAASSSSSAIRGKSCSLLYIDENAFVENWDVFSASVLPTLSSGEETKMIFTSTPHGLNHFFYYCEAAKQKANDFYYIEVPWYKVPGRDAVWKEKIMGTINHDEEKFLVEFECVDYSTIISLKDDTDFSVNIPIGDFHEMSLNLNANSSDDKYDISLKELFQMQTGVVYKLTRADGLEYVGITCNLQKRLNAHKISKRFSEYQILDVEVLFRGSYDECSLLEESFITEYDTFNNGLNTSKDGKGCNPNPESSPWMTIGKKHTEKTKEKMRANNWSKRGFKNPLAGKSHTTELKQHWSELRTGKCWHPLQFDAAYKENIRKEYSEIVVTKEIVAKYCATKYISQIPDDLYTGIKFKSGHQITEELLKTRILSEKYSDITLTHLRNIVRGKTLD